MLRTKVLKKPVLLQTETRLWGTHEGGWNIDIPVPEALPVFPDLEKELPESVFSEKIAALILPEIAFFPLKIQVEEHVKAREMESFLKWNLKSRLPFPSEDAWIRFTPIQNTPSWLVFSLPGSWINETHLFFQERQVQLGYIGTIAGLFMESGIKSLERVMLAYHSYYIYLQMKSGKLTGFTIRKYPLANDSIQFAQFIGSDFELPSSPVPVLCFSESRMKEWERFISTHENQVFTLMGDRQNAAHFLTALGGRP